MNNVLKIKQTDAQTVYFTSDTHYNHNPKWNIPLWESRGHKNVSEMNEYIIEQINATVKPNDILFHLGDITLNCADEQFVEFIDKIKCQNIYLLWGNHNNPCQKIYETEIRKWLYSTETNNITNANTGTTYNISDVTPEIYPFRYKNLIFAGNYLEVIVDGKYCILSHYPISSWNHSNGSYMLHGHCHGSFKQSLPTEKEFGKILDVGWDVFSKPITFKEVDAVMNLKKIISVDHHIS